MDLLVWSAWLILGTYIFWFLFKAETLQPLTLDELVMLWKLHRQRSGCNAPISKVEPIIRSSHHENEFVGFRCKCGYEYLSKRLVTQKVLKT